MNANYPNLYSFLAANYCAYALTVLPHVNADGVPNGDWHARVHLANDPLDTICESVGDTMHAALACLDAEFSPTGTYGDPDWQNFIGAMAQAWQTRRVNALRRMRTERLAVYGVTYGPGN